MDEQAARMEREAAQEEEDDEDELYLEMDETGRYGKTSFCLGQGAYKAVYKAFDEEEGIEVAWNQVKIPPSIRKEERERLFAEVELLKSLKNDNLIRFYASWVDTKAGYVNFITEFFTSGNLRQYSKKHKHCDVKAVYKWSRQILRGLLYLHSHDPPIIHRDLKCENIFVNGNHGEIKIGDLGLATLLKQNKTAQSVIGTPEFMAPELYDEKYDERVDIYAFGMCLLELVTHEYPYNECENAAQIYKRVTTGRHPKSLEKITDVSLRSLIEICIGPLESRPSAQQLLEHPILQEDAAKHKSNIPRTHSMEDRVARERPPSPPQEKKGTVNRLSVKSAQAGTRLSLKSKLNDNGSTLNLTLKMDSKDGNSRIIEFPFDLRNDTARSVASEMVEELSLSDEDSSKVMHMISSEVARLTGTTENLSITTRVESFNEGIKADHRMVDLRKAMSEANLQSRQGFTSGDTASPMTGSDDDATQWGAGGAGCGTSNGSGSDEEGEGGRKPVFFDYELEMLKEGVELERERTELDTVKARHVRELEEMLARHQVEEESVCDRHKVDRAERERHREASLAASTAFQGDGKGGKGKPKQSKEVVNARMKDMEARALMGLDLGSKSFSNKEKATATNGKLSSGSTPKANGHVGSNGNGSTTALTAHS